MPAQKYSDDIIERAVEMREQGKTYARIESATGMSKGAIYWHCLRLGADCPTSPHIRQHKTFPAQVRRGNHVVRRFTPDEDARIIQMRMDGVSVNKIGKALGRRHHSIMGRLMTLARNEERREVANDA